MAGITPVDVDALFTYDAFSILAWIALEEGPRLLTNLVEVSNDAIRANMTVEIVFDDVTEDVTLAKFKSRPG